jgi:hypothetical protein
MFQLHEMIIGRAEVSDLKNWGKERNLDLSVMNCKNVNRTTLPISWEPQWLAALEQMGRHTHTLSLLLPPPSFLYALVLFSISVSDIGVWCHTSERCESGWFVFYM